MMRMCPYGCILIRYIQLWRMLRYAFVCGLVLMLVPLPTLVDVERDTGPREGHAEERGNEYDDATALSGYASGVYVIVHTAQTVGKTLVGILSVICSFGGDFLKSVAVERHAVSVIIYKPVALSHHYESRGLVCLRR